MSKRESEGTGESSMHRIDLGKPALLEFRGPDAERFLNGQLTQDVRLVAGGKIALPSCVTDAKGRLQFRVWVTAEEEGALWVEGPADLAAELETRLTRYLIADDVEVCGVSGNWRLVHFTGAAASAPAGVMVRKCARFGIPGTDWWIPSNQEPEFPSEFPPLDGDALEAFRIRHGIPAWGRELTDGILPPEAGLDATDISYHKGCYIGQEVISRIKFAGKVNQRCVRMVLDGSVPEAGLRLVNGAGEAAGRVTSISPCLEGGVRHAMGYVKRGVGEFFVMAPDGSLHGVRMV